MIIETWLHQDINEPVKVNYLNGNLFTNNGNGNQINVLMTDKGEPVNITGTVSGYVVTADGSTVPCVGGAYGNRAAVLIPAAAYQPGPIFITVFVTDGTQVTTIGAVSSTVLSSRTNAQVDPGSVVTDWTQMINAAMQAVQTAAANMSGIIAVPYASITFPVPLGKYTVYNDNLYRCITPIASSESFTAAHWTQVRLGDDVSDLKSAIAYNVAFLQGGIDPAVVADNDRTDRIKTGYIDFSRFELAKVASDFQLWYFCYNSEKTEIITYSANNIKRIDKASIQGEDIAYIRFCIVYNDSARTIDPTIQTGFELYINYQTYIESKVQNLQNGSSIETGAIKSQKTDFALKNLLKSDAGIIGYYLTSNTLTGAWDWFTYDQFITIKNGESLYIKTKAALFLSRYREDESYISRVTLTPSNGYAVYTNIFGSDMKVKISCENNINNPAYLLKAFICNGVDGKIIVESDDEQPTIMTEYNSMANTPAGDIGTFDSSKFIYYKRTYTYDRYINRICFTSSSSRNLTVAVGLVDQRGWFVAANTYSIPVTAGENVIDTSALNIFIEAGQTIAINVVSGDTYDTKDGIQTFGKCGQFESLDNINVSDFTGIPFFVADDTNTSDDKIKVLSNSVSDLEKAVSSIDTRQTILYKPDGTAYRMFLNNNLVPYYVPVIPAKFACIGNSITMHPISTSVNWLVDDRGMAATRQAYDYCHRMLEYFQETNSSCVLADQYNYASWETSYQDRDATFYLIDAHLSSDLDLVTIQLGENATNLTTIEDDYKSLIAHVRSECPNALVVMIGDCFGSTQKDEIKKAVCSEMNVPFANIMPYKTTPNFNVGMGTTIYKGDGTTFTVTNGGVAGHPGDIGMRCIAESTLRIITGNESLVLPDDYH